MKTRQLKEEDLEEVFSRAAGPGGQNVNKVASRVTLRHLPSNLSVSVQDSRSQAMNRQLARERLLKAVQDQETARERHATEARELARRRSRPRPPKLKRRILEEKKRRSETKQGRKRVKLD